MAALQAANSVACQSTQQVLHAKPCLVCLYSYQCEAHACRTPLLMTLLPFQCRLQQLSPPPAKPPSVGQPATTALKVSRSHMPTQCCSSCWMQPEPGLHQVLLLLPLMPGAGFVDPYPASSRPAVVLPADALVDDVRKLQLSQQQARALAEKGAPQDNGCSSACEDFDDEDRIRAC